MSRSRELSALFSVDSAEDYLSQVKKNWHLLRTDEIELKAGLESFSISGYCLPCDRSVEFKVDYLAGGSESAGPNWRERLVCPSCFLSNRQRQMATLVSQVLSGETKGKQIYLMEQVTPLARYLSEEHPDHRVIGSEYFGSGFRPGQRIWPWHYLASAAHWRSIRSSLRAIRFAARMMGSSGFRHEDSEHLSFEDASLDFIVSNDVFEHVADPVMAFSECARVLKTGGILFATFPFSSNAVASRTRAKLGQKGIEYLEPPEYHGDPTSSDGALVFTDFGADVFQMFRDAGFSKVNIEVFVDPELGHIGAAPVFLMVR